MTGVKNFEYFNVTILFSIVLLVIFVKFHGIWIRFLGPNRAKIGTGIFLLNFMDRFGVYLGYI